MSSKTAHTLRIGKLNGEVYGLFYRRGERHIAPYVPFEKPPSIALCDRYEDIWTSTHLLDNVCSRCVAQAKIKLGDIEL